MLKVDDVNFVTRTKDAIFFTLKFGLGLHIPAFSTLKGTQSNVSIYVRIFLPHRTKPVKFIHEKAFDKMGGYLYHSHTQISKSF